MPIGTRVAALATMSSTRAVTPMFAMVVACAGTVRAPQSSPGRGPALTPAPHTEAATTGTVHLASARPCGAPEASVCVPGVGEVTSGKDACRPLAVVGEQTLIGCGDHTQAARPTIALVRPDASEVWRRPWTNTSLLGAVSAVASDRIFVARVHPDHAHGRGWIDIVSLATRDGSELATWRVGSSGDASVQRMLVVGDALIVAGSSAQDLSIGGVVRRNRPITAFVAKLSLETGTAHWLQTMAGNEAHVEEIAVTDDGGYAFVGRARGRVRAGRLVALVRGDQLGYGTVFGQLDSDGTPRMLHALETGDLVDGAIGSFADVFMVAGHWTGTAVLIDHETGRVRGEVPNADHTAMLSSHGDRGWIAQKADDDRSVRVSEVTAAGLAGPSFEVAVAEGEYFVAGTPRLFGSGDGTRWLCGHVSHLSSRELRDPKNAAVPWIPFCARTAGAARDLRLPSLVVDRP